MATTPKTGAFKCRSPKCTRSFQKEWGRDVHEGRAHPGFKAGDFKESRALGDDSNIHLSIRLNPRFAPLKDQIKDMILEMLNEEFSGKDFISFE